MNKLLSLILLLPLLVALPSEARKKKNADTPSPAEKSTTQNGLFKVVKSGSGNETKWYFIVPDSLLEREMLVTVRYTSTPANTGKYGGE